MSIKLRPLEREDLLFVHQLNNNDSIMRYWFEEAYESFAELAQLYERNIHNQTERRFIIATDRSWWKADRQRQPCLERHRQRHCRAACRHMSPSRSA